jgi:opacity protein-like surface antigen
MKKTVWLFLLFIVMAGSRVLAQSTATPTAIPSATSPSTPTVPVTAQSTPGRPIFYFSLGMGTALIGNGFGTEGNPWIDTETATLANGYGDSFHPSEALAALVGFNLTPNLSVNLSLESYTFGTAFSSASNEINFIPALRYTFDNDWIAPYVTAGVGFNFNTTSASVPASILSFDSNAGLSYNTQVISNTVAAGGLGLLFKIAGDNTGHVYLEAQYQQVYTAQGSFSYYPLTIGYQYP